MNRRPFDRWVFDRARTVLCVLLIAFPFLLAGQTNSPAPTYRPNRYLLLVETSHAMQRRSEGMTRAVRDLLSSGLGGQARRGDTLGVWTFNEELYSGLLPLQQWSPDGQKVITDRVSGFLASQKFDKRARFDKVAPALDRVVRASPFITIILVCMGEEEIQGTPFDQRINEFFKTWRLQQQDAGTPFVIAFRAQGGKFVDCTMNPSPWPAELPALPRELMVPLPAQRPVVKEQSKPAISSVPPLIISGRKRESTPAVKNPDATTTNAQLALSATNTAAPSVAGLEQPGRTDTNPSALTTLADPGSSPALPSGPGISPPQAPMPAATQNIAPSTPNSPPITQGQPSTAAEVKAPQSQNPEPAVISKAPGSATPSKTQSAPTIEQAASPEPSALAARSTNPDHAAPDVKPISDTSPVQMATMNSASNRAHSVILWIAGLLSLSAATGAVWLWRRNSRSKEEISLITQSIDRRKK